MKIKLSEDFRDGSISEDYIAFEDMTIDTLDYKVIKNIGDELFNAEKDISSDYDDMYEDRGLFYSMYYPIAKKASELSKEIRVSGYGVNDYYKIRCQELLRAIDHNFPYGWKRYDT